MDKENLRKKDEFQEFGASCPDPGMGGNPGEENLQDLEMHPRSQQSDTGPLGSMGEPVNTSIGGTMGGSLNEPGSPIPDVNRPGNQPFLQPEDITPSGYETLSTSSSPDVYSPASDISVSAKNVNVGLTPGESGTRFTSPPSGGLGYPPQRQPQGMSSTMSNLPQKVSETAELAADKTKEQVHAATEKTREVRKRADTLFMKSSDTIADTLREFSQALHRSGEEIEHGAHPDFSRYLHSAADSLHNFSGNMRGKDIGEVIHRTEDMARRRPGVFIGSAVAVGFAIGRFLKSSSRVEESRFRPSEPEAGRQVEYSEPSVATMMEEETEEPDVY